MCLAVEIKIEKEKEYYALGRLPVPITSYPFSRGEMSGAHHITATVGEVQTIGGCLNQALLFEKLSWRFAKLTVGSRM